MYDPLVNEVEPVERVLEVQDNTQHWTNELKDQILRESETNLFFFARAVCGLSDITVEAHKELCDCLDGRGTWGPNWNRALIAAFRGWFKSSVIRAWSIREALFRVNWCMRYFGASFDNASTHFLKPLQNLFWESDGKEFRSWLFETRLPRGYKGWTEDMLTLVRTDPNAPPAITIKGASSAKEGYHGNCIVADDLEGAEVDKGGVEQAEALRIASNLDPLLIHPKRDRILILGTSHGPDPLIYRALYENFNLEDPPPTGPINWDNASRSWKVFWQTVYKSDGSPAFPERIDESTIQILKQKRKTFATQYLLQRGSAAGQWWDRKTIEHNFAKWEKPEQLISYPYLKVNLQKYRDEGILETKKEIRMVRTDEMLYFIHFDPKHKKHTTSYQRAQVRPSRAAVVVTGTTPDGHVIVMDYWLKQEADLEDQLEQLRLFHVKYGARKLSVDPIGAQAWLRQILQTWERKSTIWKGLSGKSLWGEERSLPRLSAILVEDKRSPRMSKEETIGARLEPYISTGQLHFFEGQQELLTEAYALPDGDFVDGIDALAQGATEGFWLFPIGHERHAQARSEQQLLQKIGLRITHYRSPLAGAKKKPGLIRPPGEERLKMDGVYLKR